MDAPVSMNMSQIELARLMQSSERAIILDPTDNEHLEHCPEREKVLRTFARQFRVARKTLKNDSDVSTFKASA